jgi:hypothetical protein
MSTEKADALTLGGLIALFRKLGAVPTDSGPDQPTWVLTPREGPPIVIGYPTKMSAEERFSLFEIVRKRLDPFGTRH